MGDSQDADFTHELCSECENGGELLVCDGPCMRAFHLECIDLKYVPRGHDWYCRDCVKGLHRCFGCKQYDDVENLVLCDHKTCGRYFHRRASCGGPTEPNEGEKFFCPHHTCKKCGEVQTNITEELVKQKSSPFLKCFRCTTAYCSQDCLPGDVHMLDGSNFLCMRHVQGKEEELPLISDIYLPDDMVQTKEGAEPTPKQTKKEGVEPSPKHTRHALKAPRQVAKKPRQTVKNARQPKSSAAPDKPKPEKKRRKRSKTIPQMPPELRQYLEKQKAARRNKAKKKLQSRKETSQPVRSIKRKPVILHSTEDPAHTFRPAIAKKRSASTLIVLDPNTGEPVPPQPVKKKKKVKKVHKDVAKRRQSQKPKGSGGKGNAADLVVVHKTNGWKPILLRPPVPAVSRTDYFESDDDFPETPPNDPRLAPRGDGVDPRLVPRGDGVDPRLAPRGDAVDPRLAPRGDGVDPRPASPEKYDPWLASRGDGVDTRPAPRGAGLESGDPRMTDPRLAPRGDIVDPRLAPRGDVVDPRLAARSDVVDPRLAPRGDVVDPRLAPRDARSEGGDPRTADPRLAPRGDGVDARLEPAGNPSADDSSRAPKSDVADSKVTPAGDGHEAKPEASTEVESEDDIVSYFLTELLSQDPVPEGPPRPHGRMGPVIEARTLKAKLVKSTQDLSKAVTSSDTSAQPSAAPSAAKAVSDTSAKVEDTSVVEVMDEVEISKTVTVEQRLQQRAHEAQRKGELVDLAIDEGPIDMTAEDGSLYRAWHLDAAEWSTVTIAEAFPALDIQPTREYKEKCARARDEMRAYHEEQAREKRKAEEPAPRGYPEVASEYRRPYDERYAPRSSYDYYDDRESYRHDDRRDDWQAYSSRSYDAVPRYERPDAYSQDRFSHRDEGYYTYDDYPRDEYRQPASESHSAYKSSFNDRRRTSSQSLSSALEKLIN